MKKIAQVVCTFPSYKGGMGNAAYKFSQELSDSGNQVVVFTPLYSNNIINNKEKKFKIFRLQPLFSFGNAAVLDHLVEHLKSFDIIHLHYPFFGTDYFVYKFKKNNLDKKLIITYHMDPVADGLKGLIFWLYSKMIMPKILKSADLITVSSFDYLKHSYAKNIFKKYPEKFVELPFGIDINHFKPQEKDKDLMNKFSIQANDKVILFVGGMDKAHYFKGLDLLIKAMGSLRGSTPLKGSNPLSSIKLVIVGEGELKKDYQNTVTQLKLDNIIKFADKVSYQDLPKYYNLSDLFILPSINKAEAFGLVLLEAMACGKAVLASDLPGVRTVPVDRERCVFKVGNVDDLTEKIRLLLSEDRLRQSIGEKGLSKARLLSNNKINNFLNK